MIDAALHILAAWVASSQTDSYAAQQEEELDELVEMLPSYIEYHRTAGWLPDPHRRGFCERSGRGALRFAMNGVGCREAREGVTDV
jgi:hypothetical protein